MSDFTYITIADFEQGKEIITILSPDDFEFARSQWWKEDRILHDLQVIESFAGCNRWCDLQPVHYRIMIMRNLVRAASLTDQERGDTSHPVVSSLNFLLAMLIVHLQEASSSAIDVMRIHRVGDHQVTFSYQAALDDELPAPPSSGGPKIVVDNTN